MCIQERCSQSTVKRLTLPDGDRVGIVHLDVIIREVSALGLQDKEALSRELLARVEARNYVPRGYESAYARALLLEYNRRSSERDLERQGG